MNDVLIVLDDLALPFSSIRLKAKGSDGGHNGLKSINECLGTQNYARLRCGIGNDFAKGQQIDYVLGEWSDEENEKLPEILTQCVEVINTFVMMGVVKAMNSFNNRFKSNNSLNNSNNIYNSNGSSNTR